MRPTALPWILALCFSLSPLMPASASGQSLEPGKPAYTLEDCISMGVERASSLLNAERDELIARARTRQSKAQIYPELSTDASYTRRDKLSTFDFGGTQVEMGKLDNYSASATLSQLLYSGGKARAGIRAANYYGQYAKLGTEIARRQLIRDIRRSFYDLLLARDRVDVESESVKQLADFVAQTEQKYRSGTASEFDLLTAKVRLANENPNLVRARSDLAVGRESFANLLKLENSNFALVGALTYEAVTATLEDLQQEGLESRTELQQMAKWLQLLKEDAKVARGDYFPTLRAKALYTGDNPDQYSSGAGDSGWGWHWTAMLTAEWSIFDGGLRRGIMIEKNLELLKAETDMEDLKRSVLLEIKQAYLDMQHAREALEGARENVDLARKALSIAKTRYDQGLSTYLEFTETNLALSTAQLAHATALRDHADAVARLRYACGQKDEFDQKESKP